MAKYLYAVLRRAIACKIMECEKIGNKEFIGDVSDWTAYKEHKNEQNEIYHLIKFTSKTNDGYKFPFDESKIVEHYDDNIINIFKFLHSNNSENEEEKCENVENSVDFNFYLVLNNCDDVTEFPDKSRSNKKTFDYLILKKELFTCCKNTEIKIHKIPKISKCFNSLSNTGFKVKENPQNSNNYEINLYPYPCNYDPHNINELGKVEIINDHCSNIQTAKNEEDLPNIDYNRILERSFIYQIEYGTEDELTEILEFCCDENNNNECCKKIKLNFKKENKCKFDKLKEFIKINQQKLKDKDLIIKFNKLSEIVKKDLCIYDFKEIFKCYFDEKIKLDEFKRKFFENRRKCAYCGVPENKLDLLYTVRSGRGYRLEYDRIISRDGNKKVEYSLSNIVLACYWCNNAKTDTFSPKEFKPIARGINIIWNTKLRKSGEIYKKILFPNKSKIWKIKEN